MAGPCACQSFQQNLLSTSKDEFAGTAPIEGNSTPTPTFVISRIPTSVFPLTSAPAKLIARYTNMDLQRAIKLAL